LDVATVNFDDTFRRMPIETEDYEKQQQASGHAPITQDELNHSTFRGFTFDGDIPVDGSQQQQGQWTLPRNPLPPEYDASNDRRELT
jgi:hypothetical protein